MKPPQVLSTAFAAPVFAAATLAEDPQPPRILVDTGHGGFMAGMEPGGASPLLLAVVFAWASTVQYLPCLARKGISYMRNMSVAGSLMLAVASYGQSDITPDLKEAVAGKGWKGGFVAVELADKDGTPAVKITKTDGEDVLWLDGLSFGEGTIELDIKGQSRGSNFIGVAFRVVDEKTYDAVYFRPFNFGATDPEKKVHHVQYMSHPQWTWSRLRKERTGQYEKGIEPAPDGNQWFHAKIVLANRQVSVYVNDAKEPSLVVKELTDRSDGSVGLWCNGSGLIANLKITPKQ